MHNNIAKRRPRRRERKGHDLGHVSGQSGSTVSTLATFRDLKGLLVVYGVKH